MPKTTRALLFSLLLSGTLVAQEQAWTPQPGSSERKNLMDTLRSSVQRELGKPVVFKVEHLKIKDGWAFLIGIPLQPDGKPMNYGDTPYEELIEQGVFDDWICALLQKQEGKWKTIIYALGATDVPYIDWSRTYRAPPAIFE